MSFEKYVSVAPSEICYKFILKESQRNNSSLINVQYFSFNQFKLISPTDFEANQFLVSVISFVPT